MFRLVGLFCLLALLAGCAGPRWSRAYDIHMLSGRVEEPDGPRSPIVSIFYATDRNQLNGSDIRFGSGSTGNLTYGTVVSRVPSNHRVGDRTLGVVRDLLNEKRKFSISDVTTEEETAFYDALRQAVDRSPSRTLNIFVHGALSTFDKAANQAAGYRYDLNMDAPLLMMSWPAHSGGFPLFDYRRDQQMHRNSTPIFAGMLAKVIREVRPDQLNIIAYSLGCDVICESLKKLGNLPEFAGKTQEVDNLLLAAPDIDPDVFDAKFFLALKRMVHNTTLYVTSNDGVLVFSRKLNSGPRLGTFSFDTLPNQEDETAAMVEHQGEEKGEIDVIDASYVNTAFLGHGYIVESRAVISDVFYLLSAHLPADRRELFRYLRGGLTNYYVIPP